MTDRSPQEFFDELIEHVEEENTHKALETLDQLDTDFREMRAGERLEVRRSSAVRQNDLGEDELVIINRHIEQARSVEIARGAFLLEVLSIVKQLEQESSGNTDQAQMSNASDEMETLVADLQKRQNEYQSASTEAGDVAETETVPPRVSVESIDAPDIVEITDSFTVSATMTNVGDSVAEEVSIKAQFSRDSSIVNEIRDDYGDVAGGEKITEDWEDIPAADEIFVSVESSNAGSDAAETTLTVERELDPIGGDNPPKDLDDDGLYEDINGDGEFTIGDVQVFFQNRNSDVVQDNAEFFNFNGSDPDEVTIGDVQGLFLQLVEADATVGESLEIDDQTELLAEELAAILMDG
jgi:hypothetical protein